MKIAEKPTVAVVIPFYNGSRWIERALRSVHEQTIAADELVIVNDGSDESERAILDELALRYGFRLLDKANGGQGSARNCGVECTTSEYICFLDQDDYFLPEHIEDLLGALPKKDLRFGFLYADLMIADITGNIIYSHIVRDRGTHPKTSVVDMVRTDMFVLPSASVISRRAFAAVGGFDPQFTGYEDDDLFMRIFRAGYTNYYIEKPVTVWCVHGESTSSGIRMQRSRLRYFKKLCATFPDEPSVGLYYFRDFLVPRFGPHFIRHALEAAKNESEHREEIGEMLREYCNAVIS
ncbi:MAG TPA: glycosyltransferase family A protein, partial [Burkholderiaceae bacterium]|nr:glycosyltransferase family A protein [Burkholderiaceae bacterium]